MEGSYIRYIIRSFFEKDASKNTQFIFRKWFRLNEHPKEKEIVMEEIWESSPSVITEQTLTDFSKIEAIIFENKANQKPVFLLFKQIASYAAAIVIIIVTTIYVTYQFMPRATLEYAQLSVSYGKCQRLKLSDGSVVTLNAGSTLIYPKDFRADTRTVYLTGEANFKVAKNPDKPFIVKTKYIDVMALGTKFNVQSYPNANYTKATLVEGSVKVNVEMNKDKSFILKPNNQFTYSHQNNKVAIVDVDAVKLATWEEGYLIFQGVTFDEIANALERKYNIVINYKERKLSQQSYYVKFNPKESIKQVMEVLCQLVNKSSYKIDGTTVYFYTK